MRGAILTSGNLKSTAEGEMVEGRRAQRRRRQVGEAPATDASTLPPQPEQAPLDGGKVPPAQSFAMKLQGEESWSVHTQHGVGLLEAVSSSANARASLSVALSAVDNAIAVDRLAGEVDVGRMVKASDLYRRSCELLQQAHHEDTRPRVRQALQVKIADAARRADTLDTLILQQSKQDSSMLSPSFAATGAVDDERSDASASQFQQELQGVTVDIPEAQTSGQIPLVNAPPLAASESAVQSASVEPGPTVVGQGSNTLATLSTGTTKEDREADLVRLRSDDPALTTLDWNYCGVVEAEIAALAEALRAQPNTTCQRIILRGNFKVTDACTTGLAAAIRRSAVLAVDLNNTGLGVTGRKALQQACMANVRQQLQSRELALVEQDWVGTKSTWLDIAHFLASNADGHGD